MNSKQFHIRTWAVVGVIGVLILTLGISLYQTQIVNGAYYAAQSRQKIANTETVEAGRGEVLDTNGQVLVSNNISYQVTLDTSRMGETGNRNRILLELLQVCRQSEVKWTDSLPISAAEPFVYTSDEVFYYTVTDENGNEVRKTTQLYRLAVKMKWITEKNGQAEYLPTAEELLGKMCASFQLKGEGVITAKAAQAQGIELPALNIGDLDRGEARGAAGVLYELYLRSKDVNRTSYIFARNVDIDFVSRVKERSLAGVTIKTASTRKYNTDYAAHLLGRVALMSADEWNHYKTVDLDDDGRVDYEMDDSVGKEGVEKAFESWLRGIAGTRSVELNTNGKVVSEEWVKEPEAGGNVMLTLDIGLQQAVEEALALRIPNLSSKSTQGAAAVVIDVKNGGVLASASYPTFNLATYSADYTENVDNPLRPLYNRAFLGTYAPGSTFKMVTGIAALEEGIITPDTQILDTGVYTYYSQNGPACWIWRQYRSTHKLQTVAQAITNSCNVFFYDVGRQLGIENLQKYASMFGLGEKTGIELPESGGVMAGPEYTESMGQTWYPGNTLSVAIGQESSQFTPLQLANYVATLVNGGTHYRAHLLKAVYANDGSEVLFVYAPEVLEQVELEPKNLEAVKAGMLELTENGSLARYFRDLDVKVGAKTGSAQVSATSSESNAVLVCFAPYDDPEIALAIVAEKGGTGSELGAVAADIIGYYYNGNG